MNFSSNSILPNQNEPLILSRFPYIENTEPWQEERQIYHLEPDTILTIENFTLEHDIAIAYGRWTILLACKLHQHLSGIFNDQATAGGSGLFP